MSVKRAVGGAAMFLLWGWAVLGASIAQSQQTQPASELPRQNDLEDVTPAKITEQLTRIESSADLNDETKSQLKGLYEQALAELESAKNWSADAESYQAATQAAPDQLRETRQSLENPSSGFNFPTIDENSALADLVDRRNQWEQALRQSRSDLATAQEERIKRTERRSKLPGELSAAGRAPQDIKRQLALDPGESLSPELIQATRMLNLAKLRSAEAAAERLKSENALYEAQGTEYLQLRIDLLTAQTRLMSDDLRRLNDEIAELRKTDSESQLKLVQSLADRLPSEFAMSIERLVQLGKQRLDLASEIKKSKREMQALTDRLQLLDSDFTKIERRLAKSNSPGIGVLLTRKRGELNKSEQTNMAVLSRNIIARQGQINQAQSELFDLEDRRLELSTETVNPEWTLSNIEASLDRLTPDEIRSNLQRSEAALLDVVISESDQYSELLVQMNATESDLLKRVADYHVLIDKNVFWVRSAPLYSLTDAQNIIPAARWFFQIQNWTGVFEALAEDARQYVPFTMIFLAVLGTLLVFRRSWQRKVAELGEIAKRRNCREFGPTLKTLGLTILLAMPGPLVVYYLGWRLGVTTSAFAQALSYCLMWLTFYYAALALMQQTFCEKGLAACHFNRTQDHVKKVRFSLRLTNLAFLPLFFVTEIFNTYAPTVFNHAFGRLVFVIAVATLALAMMPLMKPLDTAISIFLNRREPSPAKNKIYSCLVVVTAVAVMLLALTGYYYSAFHLVRTILDVLVLLFGLLVTSSLLNRWVRVQRRNLAYQQAIERRKKELENQETGSEVAEMLIDEDEIDVTQVDDQSRRLIRNLMSIVGLLGLIWATRDIVAALTILENVQLWPREVVDGTVRWVSLRDCLLAILVILATATLGRNIPGLVEMIFSKQSRIESSVRYAIGQLSSYTVIAVGIIAGFGLLGLTWSKLQWLVAALGVGLGFGLQEIFANFVAGIIILFERPIRVGDVITMGDTTGVVTKVQIRATTIRNWDRQDLIVPNRDLITGQLLNWTLAGGLNRITFDVSVAYGSDMRRVNQLLHQILAEHPRVLETPAPLVTFQQFGDSSLNIRVAAYLPEIDDRLSTTNDLHTLIHEAFARESIEIPFPQRDLNIRSIKDVVRTQRAEDEVQSGFSSTD